jgi:TRAP-type C4-dicarboxylate transport system permease small subunit
VSSANHSDAASSGPVAVAVIDPDTPLWLQPLARALLWLNQVMVTLGMVALLVASLVLTYSVISRYVMQASTDWQDEAAVFCLVGATFLCGSFVQAMRGHVGIEAIASWLPKSLNKVRLMLVDLMGALFCSFFSWKSWTLFHEAWIEHQTTSSSWAPPLSIPYGLMAAGMTLLSLQLLVQLSARVNSLSRKLPGAPE